MLSPSGSAIDSATVKAAFQTPQRIAAYLPTTGCIVETIAATGNNTPASSTTNPAACSPDIRDIQEFSAGWWYDFYRGAKGRFRQGFQYSYLIKQTWRGTGGSPNANINMWFTSFRYFLP